MDKNRGRKKVAILGGGVGAMTAAYQLTSPEVADEYDVTVYQMGWRLGGKGASGRNAEYGDRIEEHGAHVWSGVYDNAFRVMRSVYAEMDRPSSAIHATWQEAFRPLKGPMTLMESFDGDWSEWTFDPPTNDLLPGEPDAKLFLPLWAYIGEGIQMAGQWFGDSKRAVHRKKQEARPGLTKAPSVVAHGAGISGLKASATAVGGVYRGARAVHRGLHATVGRALPDLLDRIVTTVAHHVGGLVLAVVRFFVRWQWKSVRHHLADPEVRKHWIFLNFAVGLLSGLHEDDILRKGVKSVDDEDFRDWLGKHIVPDPPQGTSAGTQSSVTLDSPLAFFLYDADFAYLDGDPTRPSYSAGVAIHSLVRLGLTWKGSILWGMHAGMGDVIFAPIYEVLLRRGVRFEFFQKVKSLHLGEDGASVEAITVAPQVELAPGQERYEPLVETGGLPVWPSEPRWDQLKDGVQLQADGMRFEDWYGPELEPYQLERGRHFDEVVLGISLGGVPYVATELIEADENWSAMVREVATVPTQSAQLWLDCDTVASGWPHAGNPTISCYDVANFTGWVDYSFLLGHEFLKSSTGQRPQSIQYLVGAMREECDPRGRIQTADELHQPAANQRIRDEAVDFLERYMYRITKNIARPGAFDWAHLVDPHLSRRPDGSHRIDSQYCRGNVQPSERYVQSVPGSMKFRLRPEESGFENLWLAGDWTWSNFNCGCVEGAVVSGLLAAHGISGAPALDSIVGLTFCYPHSPYRARMTRRS